MAGRNEVAVAYVSLMPSTLGFTKALEKELKNAADGVSQSSGASAGQGFMAGFGGSIKGLAKLVGGAFAAVKTGGAIADIITSASDLNEAINLTNRVFGDSGKVVNDWAKNAAEKFGLSRAAALQAVGVFGAMAIPIGITGDAAVNLSENLVQVATDLGSLYNTSTKDALTALRSGIIGEQEPLRRYGINITEARLKAQAFQDGLVSGAVDANKLSKVQERVDKATRAVAKAYKDAGPNSTKYADAVRDADQANADLEETLSGKLPDVLSAQQKMLAANAIITHDAALAAGDFARTGDQFEGSVKKLKAHFEDFKAAIGTPFLGAIASAIGVLNHGLFPAMAGLTTVSEKVAKGFGTVFKLIKSGFSGGEATKGIGGLSAVLRDLGVDIRVAYDFLKRIGDLIGGAFAQAAGIGSTVLGLMSGHMGGIKIAAEILVPSLAALVTTFIALKIAAEAAAAVELLAKAFALLQAFVLANPVTLAISAIVAIGVAAFIAYKKIKPFRDFIDGLITSLTRSAVFVQFRLAIASLGPPALIAQRALGLVKNAVFSVIDALKGLGAQQLGRQVLSGIGAVAKQLVKTIGNVALAISTVDASPIGRGLKLAFTGAGAVIRSAVLLMGTFWDAIKNVALALLKLDWAKFFGGLVRVLVPVVAAFYRLIGAVFRFSGALILLTRSALANLGSVFVSIIKRVMPPLLAGFLLFAQIAGKLVVRALNLLGKGLDFLTAHMDDIRKAFAATGAFIAGTLIPAIERFGRRAIDALAPVAAFIVTRIIPAVVRFAKAAGPALLAGFLAFVRFLVNDVVPVAKRVGVAIGDAFSVVVGFIRARLIPAIVLVGPAIGRAFGTFARFMTRTVLPALGSFAEFLVNKAIPAIARFATAFVKSALPPLKAFVTYLVARVAPVVKELGLLLGDVFAAAFRVTARAIIRLLPWLKVAAVVVGAVVYLAFKGLAALMKNVLIPAVVAFAGVFKRDILPVLLTVGKAVIDFGTRAILWLIEKVRELIPHLERLANWIVDSIIPPGKRVSAYILSTVVPALKSFGEWLGPKLVSGGKAIGQFVQDTLVPVFKTIWSALRDDVIPALRDFAGWVQDTVIPKIQDLWKAFHDDILPVIKDVAAWVRDDLIPQLQAIGAWIDSQVIPALQNMWRTFHDDILPVIKDVAAWVRDNLIPVLGDMRNWIVDKVIPGTKDMSKVFHDDILPIFKHVRDAIRDDLLPPLTNLYNLMKDVGDLLDGPVFRAFVGVYNNVQDLGGKFDSVTIDSVIGFYNSMKRTGDFIDGTVMTIFRNMGSLLVDVIAPAFGTAKTKVTELFDYISTHTFEGAFVGLYNGFADVINLIIDKWNALSFTVPDVFGLPGGGQPIGVPQIKHIPKLANGGVLNSPTLALLGENPRTTPEIASPVALMRDTFRSELDRFGSPTKTGVHIEHFHSTEPSRSILEEMAWRINSGVL